MQQYQASSSTAPQSLGYYPEAESSHTSQHLSLNPHRLLSPPQLATPAPSKIKASLYIAGDILAIEYETAIYSLLETSYMKRRKPYDHLISEHLLCMKLVLSSHGKPTYRTGFPVHMIEPPINTNLVKLMQARKSTHFLLSLL